MLGYDYPLTERTIGRILREKAQRIGERPFLRWQGQVFTYADLESMTNRYANGFIRLGIQKGDHVVVMLPNAPAFLWVVWGLGKIGAVAVPLNTAAKGEMLKYFIEQSDACCVVVDDEYAERIAAVAGELSKVKHFVYRTNGPCPRHGLALSALESPDDTAPPIEKVRHDDTQYIIYTSGTTGPSKGVMCPHSQGQAVGRAIANAYGYRPDDVLYTCLPLFHANALWFSCCAALWADASVALSPRFSATRFWDEIRETGATQFNSLGAMTNILLQLPAGAHEREHALRQCMAVPMQKDVFQVLRDRYGVAVTSVFAMSENFAVTTFTPDDPPAKAGSAGAPHGESALRIVGDDGNNLPAGQVGEIQLRSLRPGSMMSGYYRMPEATAAAFVDGWFCTGDRGYLDADGYLYFVDRKKEAIRRRGENISAYEVEMILSRHPAILEVAAIPVPSELSEDEVMVYVVLKPGFSISQAEVVYFAAEHMSHFMVPRFVAFVGALPKTATEKIEKYKLKQLAQDNRSQLWDREAQGVVVGR